MSMIRNHTNSSLAKRLTSIMLAFILALLLFPAHVAAASVSFSISGPATLAKGATGVYTVKATLSDAAAVQMKLSFDANFFELVSGNLNGVWDSPSNVNATITLTEVTLRCKADPGSSGILAITGVKAARLTGSLDNPTESIAPSGGSKYVSNPVPTPVPTAGPTSTPTPRPTPKPPSATVPASSATATASAPSTTSAPVPSAVQTISPAPTAAPGPSVSPAPGLPAATPAPAQPDPWLSIAASLSAAQPGATVAAQFTGNPQLPASVLQALKEKGSRLDLDFGTYAFRIDGRLLNDIVAGQPPIDLTLSTAPDERLLKASGGSALYQLHFAHDGELPGRFAFTIRAERNTPGSRIYLYRYYGTAGVIEAVQSAIVAPDGTVTFELFHCSDYFVSSQVIAGAVNQAALSAVESAAGADSRAAGIPIWAFLLALLATVAASVLLTLRTCKAGPFRSRG